MPFCHHHTRRLYASQSSGWFGQVIQRSDDGGETWREVSGTLPSDFSFPIAVHAHDPETIYVIPTLSDSLHYPPGGRSRAVQYDSSGVSFRP